MAPVTFGRVVNIAAVHSLALPHFIRAAHGLLLVVLKMGKRKQGPGGCQAKQKGSFVAFLTLVEMAVMLEEKY